MGKEIDQTTPAPLSSERGPQLYWLAVSAYEAELIMDSFKVSTPLTRSLALKVASLVLEIAAAGLVGQAVAQISEEHRTAAATERLRAWREEQRTPGGA